MTTLENNQTHLTTVGVDTEHNAVSTAKAVAEASYQRLREAVGRYVAAAIQSGKLVVMEKPQPVPGSGGAMVTYGPVQFSHWQAHLPEEAQQYYNCRYCQQVWAGLSTLAVMDEDGYLYYPVAAAFLECADDPVIAKLFENYPEVKVACGDTTNRRATIYPLDRLSDMYIEHEVGGFCHFFGFQDKDVLRLWNKDHEAFNDQMYIKGLFEQFISTEINLPLLTKLFQYIEKEIGEKEHTALSRADELVKIIGSVRRAQNLSGRGYAYLWALLHKKENGWLRHVNGSLLGIVLDTAIELRDKENMSAALANVKNLLKTATAGENYKQKTAESSLGALEQTFKFLEQKGLKGTMERRLLPISEVDSIIWHTASKPDVAVEVKPEVSAADAAFNKLLEKKDGDVQANKKMDEILGAVNVEKRMSLAAFIEGLDAYDSLAFTPASRHLWPVFATTSANEGDHEELLNFVDGVGKHVSLLNTPRPYAFPAMVDLAGLTGGTKMDGMTMVRMMSGQRMPNMPITAILRAGKEGFIAHVHGFALNFQDSIKEHGSCILGTTIKSEHFGMSRALVELSKQIPMKTDAGADATGGVFMAGDNSMVLKAVLKDGTTETIYITSAQ